MSKDLKKLQRLLEQATAAKDASDDLDLEAASLRDAWIAFGRLLDAVQPAIPDVPVPVAEDDPFYASPLSLREEQVEKAMPRRSPARRRFLSMASLAAAALLIGVLTTWAPPTTDQSERPTTVEQTTAAINVEEPTLVQQKQNRQATATADDPQWDDTLDEQICQVGQRMTYAQQGAGTGASALVRYGIEKMQEDLERDKL